MAGGGGEGGGYLVGGGGEVGEAGAATAGGVGSDLGGVAGQPVAMDGVGADLGGGLVAGELAAGDDRGLADAAAARFMVPMEALVAEDQAAEGGGGDGADRRP